MSETKVTEASSSSEVTSVDNNSKKNSTLKDSSDKLSHVKYSDESANNTPKMKVVSEKAVNDNISKNINGSNSHERQSTSETTKDSKPVAESLEKSITEKTTNGSSEDVNNSSDNQETSQVIKQKVDLKAKKTDTKTLDDSNTKPLDDSNTKTLDNSNVLDKNEVDSIPSEKTIKNKPKDKGKSLDSNNAIVGSASRNVSAKAEVGTEKQDLTNESDTMSLPKRKSSIKGKLPKFVFAKSSPSTKSSTSTTKATPSTKSTQAKSEEKATPAAAETSKTDEVPQSNTDTSNDESATPKRIQRRKVQKRPYSPGEETTPSPEIKPSKKKSEVSTPVTTEKRAISTPASAKRAKNYSPEEVVKPFSLGWMREVVHRASGKGIDIYYFNPEGGKLRSMPEIIKYLNEHKNTGLTPDNFTFCKETIYRHPFETERGARVRTGEGADTPIVTTPVHKPSKPKPESAKSVAPQKPKPETVDSTPTSSKSVPEKQPKKRASLATTKKIQPEKNESSATISIKQTKEIDSKTEKHNEVPSKELPEAKQSTSKTDSDSTKEHSVSETIGTTTEEASNEPSKDTRTRKAPQRLVEEEHKPGPPKKAKVKYTPIRKTLPIQTEQPFEPCTSRCSAALFQVPTLQCNICLCMFHPQCVSKNKVSKDSFVCRSCLKNPQNQVQRKNTGVTISESKTSSSNTMPEVSLQMLPPTNTYSNSRVLDRSLLPPPPPLQRAPGFPRPAATSLSFLLTTPSPQVMTFATPPQVMTLGTSNPQVMTLGTSNPQVMTLAPSSQIMTLATPSSQVMPLASSNSQVVPLATGNSKIPFTVPAIPKSESDMPTFVFMPRVPLQAQNLVQPLSQMPNVMLSASNIVKTDSQISNASPPVITTISQGGLITAASIRPLNSNMTLMSGPRFPAPSLAPAPPGKMSYKVFVPPRSCIPVKDIIQPFSASRNRVPFLKGKKPLFAVIRNSDKNSQRNVIVKSSVSSQAVQPSISTSTPKNMASLLKPNNIEPPKNNSFENNNAKIKTAPRKKPIYSSDSSGSDLTDSDSFANKDSKSGDAVKNEIKKPNPRPRRRSVRKKKKSSGNEGDDSDSSSDVKPVKQSGPIIKNETTESFMQQPVTHIYMKNPDLNTFTKGYEFLNTIFKELNICDLLRVAQVSKSWSNLASQRFLWENISFEGVYISDWVRCSESLKKHGTKALSLHNLLGTEERDIWKDFVKGVNNLSNIERITFGQVPPYILESVFDSLPLLESLECFCLTTTHKKPDLWSTTCNLKFFNLRFLRKLKKLKIRSAGGLISDSEPTEFRSLRCLEYLSLTSLKNFPGSHFRFLSYLHNLVTLELGDCSLWEEENYEILGTLANLRQLRLENGGGLKVGLATAISKMTKLEELELMKFIIPSNLGPVLKDLEHLNKLDFWPENQGESAVINFHAYCAAIKATQVSYFCWGIISEDDCIPLLPLSKEIKEDEAAEDVEKIHYEDLFERLCVAMPDSKVEMKCISEDFLNQYCTIQQR